jgi:hypothetical protein
MSLTRLTCHRIGCALALAAIASGCATPADPPTQQIEVHTILDHREVSGVGCVLGNSAGRWFVVTPGRVTVQRSRDALTVDCARAGTGSAVEIAQARSTSVFDSDRLIGNIIISAGLDGYVSRFDGAGVAYQSTLNVLMHPAPAPAPEGMQDADSAGNPLF